VPGFVIAQVLGGGVAVLTIRALYPDVTASEAATVVLPHSDDANGEVNEDSAATLPSASRR
jgi:hypothetical protein